MAFTGRAVDSAGVFAGQPEDVSPLITIISPTETPFLDAIGDAQFSAQRVLHEWLEDSLNPNALLISGGVTSVAGGASSNWTITGMASYIQEGTVLRGPDVAGAEYVYVSAVYPPNSIVVTRGFGGTTTNSAAAADYWMVISEAQPDGRDVARDISRPRVRSYNYTHEIMRDIIIAGAEQAVRHLGGIDSEWDYQVRQRTREALIGLERAALMSVWSGNSIGGANSVRTMRGLLPGITTNVNSFGTVATSLGVFEANLLSTIQQAWQQGGTDIDYVMPGSTVKTAIDQLNASRVRNIPGEGPGPYSFINRVEIYDNTYGIYRIMMNRWMPSNRIVFFSSQRIKIAPLVTRSFHAKRTADTGDSIRGYVLGEYTMEGPRNEKGMSQAYFPGIGSVIVTP